MSERHEPSWSQWRIVVHGEDMVVLATMCQCGHEDCGFTATIYPDMMVHTPPREEWWCRDRALVTFPDDYVTCERPRGHQGHHAYGDLYWWHADGVTKFTVIDERGEFHVGATYH